MPERAAVTDGVLDDPARAGEGSCAACGLRGHRYGTTDPHHEYSATACINGLTFEIRALSYAAMALAERISPELAAVLLAEAIHDAKEQVYARYR